MRLSCNMVVRDLELKLHVGRLQQGFNKVVTWLLQVGDNYLDNMNVTNW